MLAELPDFSASKILVLGDLMLDRYWHGLTSRISPEAPVPVVHVQETENSLGGAGNVALNIRSLGSHPYLLGWCGDDEAANTLEQKLQAAQVMHTLKRDTRIPTITKLRVLSRHQQLLRLDFEDGKQQELSIPSELLAEYKQQLITSNAVILSDYGKGTLSNPQLFIQLANAAGVPVFVDPKGNDFSRYKGATLLTPNLKEFETVVGSCRTESELVSKGQQLIADCDLKALLITRSEQGMTLLLPDQPEVHVPARAREVFDVTGAGDTVIAVLASCYGAGATWGDAVKLANLAAGIVVGRLGAASVAPHELRRALRESIGDTQGIVNLSQLIQMVTDAKAHGEKVVMTNGCFDILHAGHVTYLQQAKALGHRLIVAVNDDASITRLKGSGRPINPLARRMAVLAALAPVDWVVSFSEDTPLNLIEAIMPDVLVKGGDYQVETIVGAESVLKRGGEVRVLPFIEGCSTTQMISSITELAEV